MVQIPTSRDVAYSGTRSGRLAPNGPSVSVGAAVADAGQTLVRSAFNLHALAEQEQKDVLNDRSNVVSTSLTKFLGDEEQRFLKAQDESSESGIGFTRSYLEGWQKRADDFAKANFEGLSADEQTRYTNTLLSRGNDLYAKADGFESKQKGAYYDRTTNQNLDTVRTQIRSNAADFGQLKEQGLAAINSTNMPEAWKAERRAQWDADAAESKWRWKFDSNPTEAISEIKAPAGSNVGRAYQRLISKGWAPHQAAGIVGNLTAESGQSLNTQARNAGDGSDGSDSIGIAQWNGARAQALKTFAASRGTDWHDLDTQIDFIDHELRGPERQAGEILARSATAEEAAAAFTGYERPAGWSASNARGSHNWAGRRDAALRIAGEKPSAEDSDFDAIPYDRRETLIKWGETEYSQQRTLERATTKDNYSLLIATQPETVREDVILRDTSLDNGDKAQLITSLHTALKEGAGVNDFIQALGSNSASVNPFDSDQTKLANKAYEKLMGSTPSDQQAVVTSSFAASTGYVPEKVQAQLRRGAASSNPSEVATAMQAAGVLQKNAPVSFGAFDGSAAVAKSLDLYRTYTQNMGYSAEEAARKLVAANDPEQVRQRDAIIKSEPVKKLLKDQSADSVAAIFDKGIFSAAPGVGTGATADQIRVGVNPEAEAAIVADYRSVLEEAIVDANGDISAAQDIAKRRFQTTYGTTSFSPLASNIVVKYPPEKAYPLGPDGSHNYVRAQLEEAMKTEGIVADAFYLQGDSQTEQDIKAGRPARYQVFYEQDGKLQRFNLPFYADVDVAKSAFKIEQDAKMRDAERQMLENRKGEDQTFPEGRGFGRLERFQNEKLYRGIARADSPLGRAIGEARRRKDKVSTERAADAAERRTFDALPDDTKRDQSLDAFLSGPFQPQGNR